MRPGKMSLVPTRSIGHDRDNRDYCGMRGRAGRADSGSGAGLASVAPGGS